jgi:hypothetical protein
MEGWVVQLLHRWILSSGIMVFMVLSLDRDWTGSFLLITLPCVFGSFFLTSSSKIKVMSRMQLTWLGQPGPITRTQQAFQVVVILTVSYYVYSMALETAAGPYSVDDEPMLFSYLRIAGCLLFMLWSVYALCRTRETVRTRYQIKEQICSGFEDLCCSLWCSCW